MGQTMYPSIEEAVYYYTKETGDENILCVQFENQQQADGLAADYHPTEATHEKSLGAFDGSNKKGDGLDIG